MKRVRGRATVKRVARNGNCPEAEAWVRVAEWVDANDASGLCRALAMDIADDDLYETLWNRLTRHRKAHSPRGWSGSYIYEDWSNGPLTENKDARVFACLWMALEAAEEHNA